MKKAFALILGNVLLLGALLVALEGVLYAVFLNPFHPAVLTAAREYHLGYARQNPMYLPECAEHDTSLAYRLKHTTCSFSGREFSTTISGNSLGVRDDEKSLEKPEIIVLGDSQAFGWGVEQDETFPAIIEQKTGRSVLNLSLPSLGTVRELRLLKRAHLTNVTDIILQYSDNDSEENRAFAGNGNKLLTMPKEVYESHVRRSAAESIAYYPGKLTRRFLPPLLKRFKGALKGEEQRFRQPRNLEAEARQLLHVLRYAPVPLRKFRLWITEVASFGDHAPDFLSTVKREYEKLAQDQKDDIGPIRTIELASHLGPEEFFVYDDHLNARGHAVTADIMLDALAKEGSVSR